VADFDPSTDPEVIALFATEAAERVLRLTACLDSLSGGDTAVLDDCRREAHTLKGTAAMMGFAEVAESARRLEQLLGEGEGAGGATDETPMVDSSRSAGGSDHSMPDLDAIRAELTKLIARVAAATTPSADE
jgi:chemotaxis protein histidine kinase CheA